MKVQCRENGATVKHAHLIYTCNANADSEEWFHKEMRDNGQNFVTKRPKGATHYFVNLIDEHRYLVSYPKIKGYKRNRTKFPEFAIEVSQ